MVFGVYCMTLCWQGANGTAGEKGMMGERGPAGTMVQLHQLVIMTIDNAVFRRERLVNQECLDKMELMALMGSQEERYNQYDTARIV